MSNYIKLTLIFAFSIFAKDSFAMLSSRLLLKSAAINNEQYMDQNSKAFKFNESLKNGLLLLQDKEKISIANLPPEILTQIFSEVLKNNKNFLPQMRLVSKQFCHAATTPELANRLRQIRNGATVAENFPAEIFLKILEYLDYKTLVNFGLASKSINNLTSIIEAQRIIAATAGDKDRALLNTTESGKKSTRIIKALIAENANVNTTSRKRRETPLGYATLHGNLETVEALIAANADVRHSAQHGKTALHHAASNGNLPIVQALVKANADTNVYDNYKCVLFTPLHWAIVCKYTDIVRTLIDANANVNYPIISDNKDDDNSTPLHLVNKKLYIFNRDGINQKAAVNITLSLLGAKSDINARNRTGKTPLDEAIASDCDAVIPILRFFGGNTSYELE